jgi:hypothetical protein
LVFLTEECFRELIVRLARRRRPVHVLIDGHGS